MGLVRQVVDALGVVAVDLAGYEADDIIATLAEQAKAAGDDVVIVTGDRDTYQLVARPARQGALQPARRLATTPSTTRRASWSAPGVTPRGTRSTPRCAATRRDNLPGVPGVGEKTAAKLITTYGDLDGIFEHVDDQTPKLRATLVENEAAGAGRTPRSCCCSATCRSRSTSTTLSWPPRWPRSSGCSSSSSSGRSSTGSNEALGAKAAVR